MEQTNLVDNESGQGRIWIIISILVLLVCIVLFIMGLSSESPVQEANKAPEQNIPEVVIPTPEVDNTASIEKQLRNIDLGSVVNDMKEIDGAVNSVR